MFCPKCGTPVPDNTYFCPTCGEALGASSKAPGANDKTAMFYEDDIRRVKTLSALCYVSFFFIIIALLLEPDSKFLRYHINQVIVLYIFALLCGVVAIVPFLGWIASFVGFIMTTVFIIMGIVHACKGEAKDLPLIGKYTVVYYD